MISLTSVNSVCSSSKWSQKNKWLQEKGVRVPPAPHTKSASGTHPRTWAEKEVISCKEILFIALAEKWREGFD